jgi:hypothetical protein
MQDQTERPLLFHGTSATFKDSIRRYGLSHRRRPYKVRHVLSILRRHGLSQPDLEAVLQTWTRSSVREKGYSLTFDWVTALHFAVANRCGESIEIYFRLLRDAQNSVGFRELPEDERQELTDAYMAVSDLVARHRPLVVAVRFDRSWFSDERAAFFTDRHVFDSLGTTSECWRREMYVGSYDPSKIYGRHGEELPSIRDIPPDAIVSLTELSWNDHLNALLESVWHRHARFS